MSDKEPSDKDFKAIQLIVSVITTAFRLKIAPEDKAKYTQLMTVMVRHKTDKVFWETVKPVLEKLFSTILDYKEPEAAKGGEPV